PGPAHPRAAPGNTAPDCSAPERMPAPRGSVLRAWRERPEIQARMPLTSNTPVSADLGQCALEACDRRALQVQHRALHHRLRAFELQLRALALDLHPLHLQLLGRLERNVGHAL